MAFQNIKRDGVNFTVDVADQLNHMSQDIDRNIDLYERRDLDWHYKHIRYWSGGYSYGKINVINSQSIYDGMKVPFAPKEDLFFNGTDNTNHNMEMVKLDHNGVIHCKPGVKITAYFVYV